MKHAENAGVANPVSASVLPMRENREKEVSWKRERVVGPVMLSRKQGKRASKKNESRSLVREGRRGGGRATVRGRGTGGQGHSEF